jgi:hypothetical protein
MPVPLKQAVANALEFAEGLLGNRAADVRLEEVESIHSDGDSAWLITLSMIRQDRLIANEIMANTWRGPRDYKTFTVLKETGEVTAMKIREFADR